MRQIIPPSISKACPTSLAMPSSQLSLQKNRDRIFLATVLYTDIRIQCVISRPTSLIGMNKRCATRSPPIFVHAGADVEWSFLAQEAGEFLVKPPVVRREALVSYLCAGQVHPNSRGSERRKTLECQVSLDAPRTRM